MAPSLTRGPRLPTPLLPSYIKSLPYFLQGCQGDDLNGDLLLSGEKVHGLCASSLSRAGLLCLHPCLGLSVLVAKISGSLIAGSVEYFPPHVSNAQK